MSRVVAGEIAIVSPRWGGPSAGGVTLSAQQQGRWHMGALKGGEAVLVLSITRGGTMCTVRTADGRDWGMERADLLPLEGSNVSEG